MAVCARSSEIATLKTRLVTLQVNAGAHAIGCVSGCFEVNGLQEVEIVQLLIARFVPADGA